MPVPGAIKRYIAGAWKREGTYIANVDALADLPVTPDEDGVFAWVENTDTMYRSQSGVWVPWPGAQGAQLNERCWLSATTTLSGIGWLKVPFNTPQAGSVNFDTTNRRWVCPTAGEYAVWASVSFSGMAASTNYRCMVSLWVNGAERSRGTDYIGGNLAAASAGAAAHTYDVLTLAAGDYVEVYSYWRDSVTGISWVALHEATYFGVRAVGTTGFIGPAGPVGPAGPQANTLEWGNFRIATATGLPASTTTLTPSLVNSSAGVTLSTTKITVAMAGVYHVTMNIGFSSAATGAWAIIGISQFNSAGTLLYGCSTTMSTAITWAAGSLAQDFACGAGDYFQFTVQPDTAGKNLDSRSQISLSQIGGSTGPQGIQGIQGIQGVPGGPGTFTDYTKADGIQSWTPTDPTNSLMYAAVINGRWVQCFMQAIWSAAIPTGNVNVSFATLVPALRPTTPAVHSMGITYPAYASCRISVTATGAVQYVHTNMPANQTQIWVNLGWPLY